MKPLRLAATVVTFCAAAAHPALARGDEPQVDERCKGTHSLFNPLPDACLEPIDTDRPHQTDTPHVVPAGHTQFESAIGSLAFGGSVGQPAGPRDAHLILFENGYKFGLTSHVDLQLITRHADLDLLTGKLGPPGPLNVRAKFNIVEETGAVPAITLVPTMFVPAASSQALRGGLLAFWGWELPLGFELEVNAGVLFGGPPKPSSAIVLATALTHPLIGELKSFVDVYATGYDIAMSTGFLMALSRDVQVDAAAYLGLSGDEPVATIALGFSIRR